MNLTLLERIVLLNILPTESNFATLKIVNDLRNTLSFTEEEYKEYEIVQDGNKLTWNLKGNEEQEITIGEKATDIIVEALKKLDEGKKLTMQQYSVYNKFISK
jgi:hypothetical protein